MNLTAIYTTDTAADAEIMRVVLEQNGIRAEVVDEAQGGYSGTSLVSVKVLVREDDAKLAKKIVEEYETPGPD